MKKSILLYSWLFISFLVQAQHPAAWHYTTEDGLPSSLIYRCGEDKDGYLWFVTDKGVSRFDGYKFQRFTLADGLTSNDVWGVETAADGRIWFSTFNTPIYFENEKFKTLSLPNNTEKPKKVENYRFDSKGLAYFEDMEGQYLIKPTDSTGFDFSKIKHHYFLTEDKSNQVWYYDMKAYRHLKIGKDSSLSVPDFMLNFSKKSESFSAHSPIELATSMVFPAKEQFVQFDFKSLKIRDWDEVLPNGVIVVGVYKFTDDWLLIKSTKGYFVLDNNLNVVEGYDFLNDYNLNHAFKDSRGNVWLCTRDDGVYFLTSAAFKSRTYTSQKESLSDDVLQLSFDKDKNLFVGTGSGDLFAFRDGKLIDFEIELPPSFSMRMMGLEIANEGAVLIGGDFGFAAVKAKESKSMSFKLDKFNRFTDDDLEWNKLYQCYVKTVELFNENVYIGHRLGISRFQIRDGMIKHQPIEKKSTPTYALSASDTSVWIGKKEGLFYWSEAKNKMVFKGKEHPVFNYSINALATDSTGNLWIGTDGFGVFRYVPISGKVDTISELKNSIAKSIFVESKENEVWIAHNNGVSRLAIKNAHSLEYEHQLLNRSHGLPSNEVDDVKRQGNNIYVGTKGGLTILDYETIFSPKNAAQLHISSVKVSGESKDVAAPFFLKPDENNISISFVCLSFKSNKEITYFYKMEGLNEHWQTTTDLKKEYTALPPGKYVFRVKAKTAEGFLTPAKSIFFKVGKVWWKTWAAIFLYFLAGGLLLRFFYKRRIRLIEAKNEEQNEINKKFAELELEALQAQMNPHFIFNAMQSIQNFILKKDERTANKYMVRFSRLMRLFLESSKKKYIPVKEEIRLLKFYIELEHLRFPDKFDYHFDIDDDLEESSLEVASMMLQPFVENAINHGLIQNKVKGNLLIRMVKKGGFLEVVIDDDGIGREAARKLREESFKHHKSRGMQLVEGRRKVLNRLNELSISLDIIDKKSLEGRAIGTRVELGLPLHKSELVSGEKSDM